MLLAGWFFFVSIGYTVTLHYCNDSLSGISILGELSSCCNIAIEEEDAQDNSICQSAKEKACDNASYNIDLDTAVAFSVESLCNFDFQQTQPLDWTNEAALVVLTVPYKFASPSPLVNQDFRILYCSYLL